MHTLASELANEASAVFVCNAAGLALKNAFTARVVVPSHFPFPDPPVPLHRSRSQLPTGLLQDSARQLEYSTRWLGLDAKIRNEIKEFVLRSLHSEQVKVGTVAAESVAAIATVELLQGHWPDLRLYHLRAWRGVACKNLQDLRVHWCDHLPR